jgi:hypothetical protein
MTQIARELKKSDVFDVLVAHYSPENKPFSFAKIIKDEGLDAILLKPHATKDLAEHLFAVDRGERAGELLPAKIVQERIENEIKFLQSHNVACVVTGFNLSFYASCRILGIPIISVLSGSFQWWMSRDPEICRMPDLMSAGIMKWMPKRWGFGIMHWFVYHYAGMVKSMNKLLRQYDKEPFKGLMDILDGDIFFASDIPEYIPIENPPENFYYTGALIGRLKADIPDEVISAQKYAKEKGWPVVYLAMGSSGRPAFIKKCLEIFSNQKMVVISPMKKMLEKDEKTRDYTPSENVFLCDWLPADKVNALCDVALIHGGQGTVYTAILSGTPFCAIGNGNPEQEFNVEAAVTHGFAKLYRRNQVKPVDLLQGLTELLNDPEAKRKIDQMSALLQRPEWNGEKRAANKIIELFG